jgi:hypothetical protein
MVFRGNLFRFRPGQTGTIATDQDQALVPLPVRTTDFVTLTVTVFVGSPRF